jgi:cytochrome c6
MIRRFVAVWFGAIVIWTTFFTSSGLAADFNNGAKIFEVQCAGCHANGGNIVRRGKTLKLKALEQNGYATEAAIAQIVTNGKNNMSAYKDRLAQAQIEDVSTYVLERAKQGWK